MKIVFPMTGPNRFNDDQYMYPKPLIELDELTMFENAVKSYASIDDPEFISIIGRQDAKEYHLDQVIKRATEGMNSIVRICSGDTAGALCTALLVSDYFGDDEIIISNYDQDLGFDVSDAVSYFREIKSDFGVVSFDSVHPKWSYVRIGESGEVVEAAEKNPISRHALAGLYYFRNGTQFVESAKKTILDAGSDKKIFYLSDAINSAILLGMKGSCYKIEKNQYNNFYDSSELKEFVTRKRSGVVDVSLELATKQYIANFDQRNIEAVCAAFDEKAVLYDPSVGELSGKDSIRGFLVSLFDQHAELSFSARRIVINGSDSVVEFILTLDSKVIKGVDLISWRNGKIQRIDAYLEIK
jgi:dTDP-glucose pyrophosphorylase